MIRDQELTAAVAQIVQRSERQEDAHKLVGTYVDFGLLPQLNNNNHQIFYGRRGTGKTHVMKVLQSRLAAKAENTVVYMDCRMLGSTSQFSDSTVPLPRRCLALFRDFLLAIYRDVLEHIVSYPSSRANEALDEIDRFAACITEPISVIRAERLGVEVESSYEREQGGVGKLSASPADLKADLDFNTRVSGRFSGARSAQYSVHSEDKVVFPELLTSLRRVLECAETRLYVLVDEWSSLPLDIQPYLAEFLKRGIVPLVSATLKISALEQRSRFSERGARGQIGFELGADIATAPDLDDYFVFDRNPEQITDVYADVLVKHLSSELPPRYLAERYSIRSGGDLASRMFTERSTCAELARASEGVMRDLINIFTQAYFNAQRRSRDNIDKRAILESARQWFEQDKAQYLDDQLQDVLRRIVDEVIGKRRARSFLLPRELEKNITIQKLFDARVLHHMQRGYADKDNPGVRYNIYAIDYGAFVDLLGTSRQPQIDLLQPELDVGPDLVVPFDDKRSIRRIILDRAMLPEA